MPMINGMRAHGRYAGEPSQSTACEAVLAEQYKGIKLKCLFESCKSGKNLSFGGCG